MNTTISAIAFDPLLPWGVLLAFGVVAVGLAVLGATKRARGLVLRLAAIFTILGALANPSLVEEERKPVDDIALVITDDSTMTQGIALVLANQMQEQGGQVNILLCDEAGDLALKNAGGEALKPNNVTPAQLLDGAMKKGATAAVCALYLPNTGHKPEDLKEGIAPAKPADMARALLEPGRKVLTF